MEMAAFLDRDGVLNKDNGYPHKEEHLVMLEGAPEGVKMLNDAGFQVIVISNQSGIGRGYFTEKELDEFNGLISGRLATENAHIDRWMHCPHHPEAKVEKYRMRCECRKPNPGMILKAASEMQIDLRKSYVFGDWETDILAGRNAGCRTGLIGALPPERAKPDIVAENLKCAVERMLALENGKERGSNWEK